jgi:hypothetical protein
MGSSMAELINPGKDIIEAFLKGVQVRQQKEGQAQRLAIAMTQAKLADERAKAQREQFILNFKQRDELNDSTIKHRQALEAAADATRKLQATSNKIMGLRSQAEGYIDFDDQGNPIPAQPGARAKVLAGQAGAVTTAQQEAKTPFDVFKAGLAEMAQKRDREDRQTFTADQNAKMRANQVAMNTARLEQRSWDQTVKRDQKIKDLDQDADDRAQDVVEGNPAGTVEMMPKGQLALDLMRRIRARYGPIRQFTLAESNDLKGMRELTAIIKEGEDLSNKIKEGGAWASMGGDTDINAAIKKLRARIEVWGRGVLEMKGVFQEGDVQRAYGSLPELNPGGPIGMFAIESNYKNNMERMKSARQMYHERIDNLFGPSIDPTQRTILYKRWNLMKKPDDPNETEVDVGKIK